MDQDQLNPYVAYEGYVVRVPHNPLKSVLDLIVFATNLKFRKLTVSNELAVCK